ncbi:hypothetical protein [Pseudalkalibacillus decolorationis]|uniref:hypothetical protein n=1 Tax=Pseudalkalibacillus decolorationis TaxID=163879 RepID=UPI002147736F|nr:hypothetical protein [Pseudalkalibacillus decolorationis]
MDYLKFKEEQAIARARIKELEELEKKEEENPFLETLNSFKEFGDGFMNGLEERIDKATNSWYDFGNYMTLGAFDGVNSFADGLDERADVATNSTYDFIFTREKTPSSIA